MIKNELQRKRLVVAKENCQYAMCRKGKTDPDILDPRHTLAQRHFKVDELYRGNSFYGNAKVLRDFANFQAPIRACIEHGVYFGDFVNPLEADRSGLPAVLTFSETRRAHITATTTKPVHAIGPYIRYAPSYLDEKATHALKARLGKALLVFPSHSIDTIEAQFDTDQLLHNVDRLVKRVGFDDVLICLYWKDYESRAPEIYRRHGYRVVTAGRRGDPYFLPRLRSLIEVSAHSASNSVGTHVGYSVALGRSHTILPQYVNYVGLTKSELVREHGTTVASLRAQEQAEVLEAFTGFEETITARQLAVVDKYWGITSLRSRDELHAILARCQEAGQHQHAWRP